MTGLSQKVWEQEGHDSDPAVGKKDELSSGAAQELGNRELTAYKTDS